MRKFPVVSKKGNVYEVRLFVGESIADAGYNIVIKEPTVKLLGWQLLRKVEHYNLLKTEKEMLKRYGSFIGIAREFVTDYEQGLDETEKYSEFKEGLVKEFEEWDGRC